MDRPRIGVSACLLGQRVRYDGADRRDPRLIEALDELVTWVPVCPEVECGLPVPRPAMRLEGDPTAPRLVVIATREDLTDTLLAYTSRRVAELAAEGPDGFVFKARSPSSGMTGVPIHDAAGRVSSTGSGLFARALMQALPDLPVEDDEGLRDPVRLSRFLERIREKPSRSAR